MPNSTELKERDPRVDHELGPLRLLAGPGRLWLFAALSDRRKLLGALDLCGALHDLGLGLARSLCGGSVGLSLDGPASVSHAC